MEMNHLSVARSKGAGIAEHDDPSLIRPEASDTHEVETSLEASS